jgi:hypothetical protein
VKARETVDAATPAASATSVRVGRCCGAGPMWSRYGKNWQTLAM